ncbi:SRPBCC family protein [Roseovarius ramblicola]|uniref:SRPBCC family protein n=1 Tax=Roseovarius ramblicola TaxID=2022336 RepID=A0ABV5HX97_9RHOB
MKFENRIDIAVATDAVFAFVADQRNIPLWNYYVVDVVQETGNGPAVGARYLQTRKIDSQHTAITQMETGKSLTVETVAGAPVVRRRIAFRQTRGGTRLFDRWGIETGYPRVLELVAVRRIRRAVASNLEKLKCLLEEGAVQLQDGRAVSVNRRAEV